MSSVLAGDQGLLWSLNARAVLDVVDSQGPLGRPELVQATGLSRTTIAQTVAALVRGGILIDAGLDRTRRGPAAQLYSINPNAAYGIAVSCGAEEATAAIVDMTGRIVARRSAEGPCDSAAEDNARLLTLIEQALADLDAAGVGARPLGCVAGVRGIVGVDGRTLRRVPGYAAGGTELHDAIAARWGCAVIVENDVNLLARAERELGAAREQNDVFLMLLTGGAASGLGGALILDGEVRRGARGGAGEIAYVPQPGLAVGQEVLGAETVTSLLSETGYDPEQGLRPVLDAAHAGETAARSLVEEIARRLALLCGAIALILEPERFVLAGLLAHPALLHAVRDAHARHAPQLELTIVPSELGADGALLGAVSRVRDVIRDHAFRQAADVILKGEAAS